MSSVPLKSQSDKKGAQERHKKSIAQEPRDKKDETVKLNFVGSSSRTNADDIRRLSLSSLISNYSQLLGNNSSSSFLIHVDEPDSKKKKTMTQTKSKNDVRYSEAGCTRTSESFFPAKTETGRQAQGLRDSRYFSSEILNADVEIERQAMQDADSWDNFDKIMEKSMPPKEWEIQEFEECHRDLSMFPEREQSMDYFSQEAAKKLLDEDEKDRAIFNQSVNATFASTKGTSHIGNDPLSMTTYFLQRNSSFPVDNCANDSTMLKPDEDWCRDDKTIMPSSEGYTVVDNPVLTPATPKRHARFQLTETILSQAQLETPAAVKSLDSKTKDLAKIMTSDKSDEMNRTAIMELVLALCRRDSMTVSDESHKNLAAIPPATITKISKAVSTCDKTSSSFVEKRTSESVKKSTPSQDGSTNNVQLEPEPQARKSILTKVGQTRETTAIRTKNADKSVVISEPGKVTKLDDKVNLTSFDEFKRHLNPERENKPPPTVGNDQRRLSQQINPEHPERLRSSSSRKSTPAFEKPISKKLESVQSVNTLNVDNTITKPRSKGHGLDIERQKKDPLIRNNLDSNTNHGCKLKQINPERRQDPPQQPLFSKDQSILEKQDASVPMQMPNFGPNALPGYGFPLSINIYLPPMTGFPMNYPYNPGQIPSAFAAMNPGYAGTTVDQSCKCSQQPKTL